MSAADVSLPEPAISIEQFSDPAAFWPQARPVVAEDPVLYSVLATTVERVRVDPASWPDSQFFLLGPAPLALAQFTAPFPIHLPNLGPQRSAALASYVWNAGARPSGVGGDLASCHAFAEVWTAHSGQHAEPSERRGVYELSTTPVLARPASGRGRIAEAADLELLNSWTIDFFLEAMGQHPPAGVGPSAAIAERRAFLWCDPAPVAMAVATGSFCGVRRITTVFTPPAHRGRGYASAVTAAASAFCIEAGDRCMLFTDLDNPTSNHIYQELGYRYLGEQVELSFCS